MLIRLYGVFVYLLKITSYFSTFYPMYYWRLHCGTVITANSKYWMQSSVYILFYLSMLLKTHFICVWTYVQCTTDSTDLMEKRNGKTKIDFVHRSYIFRSEFRIERFFFHYFFLFISHWSLFSLVIWRARIHFYFIIIAMIADWNPWIQLIWKCTVSSTVCTVHSSSITYSGLKKNYKNHDSCCVWIVLLNVTTRVLSRGS